MWKIEKCAVECYFFSGVTAKYIRAFSFFFFKKLAKPLTRVGFYT